MRPRVCVVSALYHPALGGLGRQAQLLTERLREEGVDLFVISRKMDFPPGAVFSPAVEVVRVPAPSPGEHILEEISVWNILISLSFSLGCLATLIRRRRDYDVVHFHGASIPLFLSLPFLKLAKKKVIAKVAAAKLGTEAGSLSGRYFILGNVLASLIRHVDRFIAISDEIREGLLHDGVPLAGIIRIANFIDPKTFYPPDPGEKEWRKAEFGYAGKTLVLFSGRLVARKGVEYLLEAWRDLSSAFPDARLLLLGDGPLKEALEEMSQRLGIGATARFLGRVDNVPEHLRAADLFVLSSLQEGMPNSLLEAMATGLPVVSTRIGGAVDVVVDGENGLLVEPGDPGGLAKGIVKLLGDPSLRQKTGGEALGTVQKRFSLDSRVKEYLQLYQDLVP